jgi:RES domain-containing protein
MATVWRIVSPRYTSQILSGVGAAQYPGRWNHSGQQLIYTAATQSLAMLEKLVYMISPFPEMVIGAITIPDKYIEYLRLTEDEASDLLADHKKSQAIGAGWINSNRSIALAVPSVHIHPANWQEEPSILINPLHPDFKKARLKNHHTFTYDNRLEK